MKVKDIKAKVDKKIAKCKVKVAAKCAKCAKAVAVAFALAFALGCQNPAQRAQTAETKQYFYVYEGATANFTFGSEFVSLAQSNETGGNDAGLTASPTTDTKPEIAVGVGGSSAGVGSSGAAKHGVGAVIGNAVDAISGIIPSSSGKEDDKTEATTQAEIKYNESCECKDSSCSTCTDGNCVTQCTDCER